MGGRGCQHSKYVTIWTVPNFFKKHKSLGWWDGSTVRVLVWVQSPGVAKEGRTNSQKLSPDPSHKCCGTHLSTCNHVHHTHNKITLKCKILPRDQDFCLAQMKKNISALNHSLTKPELRMHFARAMWHPHDDKSAKLMDGPFTGKQQELTKATKKFSF